MGVIIKENVASKLASEGVKWGDAVAWATKKLGLTQCPPCKTRQAILNEVRLVGWAETIKRLKETI